jgi:hypothetical protein
LALNQLGVKLLSPALTPVRCENTVLNNLDLDLCAHIDLWMKVELTVVDLLAPHRLPTEIDLGPNHVPITMDINLRHGQL